MPDFLLNRRKSDMGAAESMRQKSSKMVILFDKSHYGTLSKTRNFRGWKSRVFDIFSSYRVRKWPFRAISLPTETAFGNVRISDISFLIEYDFGRESGRNHCLDVCKFRPFRRVSLLAEGKSAFRPAGIGGRNLGKMGILPKLYIVTLIYCDNNICRKSAGWISAYIIINNNYLR